jgi:hypothetical protein
MEATTLLDETKIGDYLSVGCVMDEEEVGLFIASADVSASCAFKFDEWERFVDSVNQAHKAFTENRKS